MGFFLTYILMTSTKSLNLKVEIDTKDPSLLSVLVICLVTMAVDTPSHDQYGGHSSHSSTGTDCSW